MLRRTADDNDPHRAGHRRQRRPAGHRHRAGRPGAALGFIDRCLVAALDGGLEPLLCLTKADLAVRPSRPRALRSRSTCRRWSSTAAAPLDELRARLTGQISVLVGHSGVGKSTLVNALVPDAYRATGDVSAIGKGRHTSSSAVALRLPDDEAG